MENLIRHSVCMITVGCVFFWLDNEMAQAQEIELLIDQLQNVAEGDIGYMPTRSGSSFMPLGVSDSMSMLLGQKPPKSSNTLRRIAEKGVRAMPLLIEHLDDDRVAKIKLDHGGGFGGMFLADEYDYNSRTSKTHPADVNKDNFTDRKHINSYTVTVGDLCFVALGQIVNRNFNCVRYQPTAIIIVNSPVKNESLRNAIRKEWGKTKSIKLRQSLILDFKKPDHESRRIGAYLRLAFYYPDVVEKLVLEFLNRPIPSSDKTSELAGQLLEIKDAAERERKLKTILEKNGKHYRDAIQNELFNEIRYSDSGAMEKRVLHETFGWTKQGTNVIRKERIKLSLDEYEAARFIRALTHDQSQLTGNRIQKIMESDRFKDDSYMVEACLTSLASRKKFGNYLAERLKMTDFRKATCKSFPSKYLSAIAKSESPGVKDQLQQIAKISSDPDLFLIAANAITRDSWKPIIKRARKILNGLPADTRNGRQLLSMILKKSPDEAESILKEFLKPNTASRCNTVCEVLWYNEPLSQKLLLPLLDDEREIPGITVTIRDRAATAISHSIPSIRYDSDWSEPQRADAIRRIKQYCQNK